MDRTSRASLLFLLDNESLRHGVISEAVEESPDVFPFFNDSCLAGSTMVHLFRLTLAMTMRPSSIFFFWDFGSRRWDGH